MLLRYMSSCIIAIIEYVGYEMHMLPAIAYVRTLSLVTIIDLS